MLTPYFWLTLSILVANILALILAYNSKSGSRFGYYLGFLASYYFIADAFLGLFFGSATLDSELYILVSLAIITALLAWNALSLIVVTEMKWRSEKWKKFADNSFIVLLLLNLAAIFIAVTVYLEISIRNSPLYGL